jgi:anti-sigma regulatory factor (Ser/Thr protein kinase)
MTRSSDVNGLSDGRSHPEGNVAVLAPRGAGRRDRRLSNSAGAVLQRGVDRRAGPLEILELALPCAASSPRLARVEVVEALRPWWVGQEMDGLLIVVSELVTNAVRHTEPHCVLRLRHSAELEITIEVDDTDHRPVERPATNELGRGLGVVQQLTERWGIERTRTGKCVWAEIRWSAGSRLRRPEAGEPSLGV